MLFVFLIQLGLVLDVRIEVSAFSNSPALPHHSGVRSMAADVIPVCEPIYDSVA